MQFTLRARVLVHHHHRTRLSDRDRSGCTCTWRATSLRAEPVQRWESQRYRYACAPNASTAGTVQSCVVHAAHQPTLVAPARRRSWFSSPSYPLSRVDLPGQAQLLPPGPSFCCSLLVVCLACWFGPFSLSFPFPFSL